MTKNSFVNKGYKLEIVDDDDFIVRKSICKIFSAIMFYFVNNNYNQVR